MSACRRVARLFFLVRLDGDRSPGMGVPGPGYRPPASGAAHGTSGADGARLVTWRAPSRRQATNENTARQRLAGAAVAHPKRARARKLPADRIRRPFPPSKRYDLAQTRSMRQRCVACAMPQGDVVALLTQPESATPRSGEPKRVRPRIAGKGLWARRAHARAPPHGAPGRGRCQGVQFEGAPRAPGQRPHNLPCRPLTPMPSLTPGQPCVRHRSPAAPHAPTAPGAMS